VRSVWGRGGGGGNYQRPNLNLVHESQSYHPRTCGFRRSMVGSVGTRQPAARRSKACRRACPAHDAGVHLRPRLGPANSLSAVRARGRRAVVKDDGIRPPNDGQAATDDARPRPPEDATLTLPQRRCTSCV
jgi:hypothetical protein